MLKNYFKIAWRNLIKNKGFSITNILSLTIGITCTILILLWMQDELNFNKFHTNYKNIYQVMAHRNFNNQVLTDPNMVMPLAKTIQEEIPQIKYAVVTTYGQSHVLNHRNQNIKKKGYTVSEHFFDMFSWKFIKGNPATAIQDAYSLILTESTAKAFFGKEDPINKIIRMDNEYNAKVTAVVADVPENSTFQFDYIDVFNYDGNYIKEAMTNWGNSSWKVFIQPVAGANMQLIEKRINEIQISHNPDNKNISAYFGFPMSKWRLYSDFKDGKNVGGMIKYVRLFGIIAFVILIIACVNFMNLSTARSEKRAKEVGVRKTLGSDKKQLVTQFFFESILLAVIAFLFSILTVFLLLPSFNRLVKKELFLDLSQPVFWISSILIIAVTGIIAGSYPALYLSSFKPIKVLKGDLLSGKKGVLPRRILVVTQFVISILLISATIIVYQQIQHIRERETGYDPDNLIMIPTSSDVGKNFVTIKQELLNTGMVRSLTRTLSPITELWWRQPAPDWEGKPANANIIFTGQVTGDDFAKTLGIKMLAGRDFSGMPSDSSSVLLNKAAMEVMGIKNPIGMKLKNGNASHTVIGIVDNVITDSPFEPVDPMMIYYEPGNTSTVTLRLNQSAQLNKALQSIESVFKKYNPAYPFEYKFVDQEFEKKFIAEELVRKLANIFSGLAIFICCIGLAGLASFTIEKRFKEIGIRKVLGASIQQVLALISKEFLKLVLIAFLIAVPLTWWLMSDWLQNYTYRVSISVWMFGIVGSMVLLLTLLIVGLNTIKAAMSNPVKSLRTE
jgi:putative ABC transport system permease protein